MEDSLLNDLLLIDEPLVEDFDTSDHDEELITDYDLVEPNLPDLYCTTSGHVSHSHSQTLPELAISFRSKL
jgi:hypothetical protein